jgi:uncharacterized protein (TIGR03067 family)
MSSFIVKNISHCVILAIWCLTAVTVSAQNPPAKKTAKEKLQGRWLTIDGEAEGKPVDKALIGNQVYEFKGDLLIVEVGSPPLMAEAKFTVNDTKNPHETDIACGSLGTNPAIFQLDGDKLRICMDKPGGKRPAEFKTAPDSMQKMFVFKRVAAAPPQLPAVIPKDLAGRWRAVRAEQGGKPLDQAQVVQIVFEFRDGELAQTINTLPSGRAKVTVNNAKKPMEVDLTVAGIVTRAIFAIDGNKLRMCSGKPGEDRPKEFKTVPGGVQTLYEFEREERK